MTFTFGNRALKNLKESKRPVFLFEYTKKGYVKYSGELFYVDYKYENIPDQNNKLRNAIQFIFSIDPTHKNQLSGALKELETGNIKPTKTERKGIVVSRVGQGPYRRSLLDRWNNRCAVTGFEDERILIASHIVAWRDSTPKERLDVNNGILLSPVYDALFDRHLISFKDNGEIIISEEITPGEYAKLGITGNERISTFTKENLSYLRRHRVNLL
jgi:predicted restriction endonuclease